MIHILPWIALDIIFCVVIVVLFDFVIYDFRREKYLMSFVDLMFLVAILLFCIAVNIEFVF